MVSEADFSRAIWKPLATKKDRLFDAILDFTRSDAGAVDFSGQEMVFDIYQDRDGTLVLSLSSDDSAAPITISTARISFNRILTELDLRVYHYELYDNDAKVGTSYGPLTVK